MVTAKPSTAYMVPIETSPKYQVLSKVLLWKQKHESLSLQAAKQEHVTQIILKWGAKPSLPLLPGDCVDRVDHMLQIMTHLIRTTQACLAVRSKTTQAFTTCLLCQIGHHAGIHIQPLPEWPSADTPHTGTHLQPLLSIGCHMKHHRYSLAATVRMALRAGCIITLHGLLHMRLSSAAARVATIGAACCVVMTCTANPVKAVLPLQLES